MLNPIRLHRALLIGLATAFLLSNFSCERDDPDSAPEVAVLLIIDEESIDNGNPPNNFSEDDVNDPLAEVGQRLTLKYFKENVGKNIELFTGEVGDEGWYALKTVPSSWVSAGPTAIGARNYLLAGTGEDLLDKVPNVTPLRATGLKMLVGKTILAVVYDSDVSLNYAPLNGNIKGANLGLVAFDVLKVDTRTDGSSSSLPRVTVRIRNVQDVFNWPLVLFDNAPAPISSSVPFDITVPGTTPQAELVPAP